MKSIKNSKRKVYFYLFVFFILIIGLSFALHYIFSINAYSRLASDADIWDGTMAFSFGGGNGSKENPYVIKSGREFAYFKYVLENDNIHYKDKNYIITKDLNMNNKEFSMIKGEFSGTLDGKGFTIGNLNILADEVDEDNYAGLFYSLNNTEISNLNIENTRVNALDSIKAGVIASKSLNTTFNNITIINSIVDGSTISGLLSGSDEFGTVSNVFLNGEIKNALSFGSTFGEEISEEFNIEYLITKVIKDDNYINVVSSNLDFDGEDCYKWDNNSSSFIDIYDELYPIGLLATILNGRDNTTLVWQEYEDNLVYEIYTENASNYDNQVAMYASIDEHDSGIVGNHIYVNDLESSWNYYMGLNYTEITSQYLPVYSNKYRNDTLVKVAIHYSGTDFADSSLVGHISPTEQETDITYYKYYPIENGYLRFDLIDNPFSARPNNKVFLGWTTSDTNITFNYEVKTYTRSIAINLNGATEISIDLNAIWGDGNIQTGFNNLSNLDDIGMQPYRGTLQDYVTKMAGYYYKMDYQSWESKTDYYNGQGQRCSSSGVTCSSGDIYKYIQPSDQLSVYQPWRGSDYYYLVTRDTNILIIDDNSHYLDEYMSSKPYTLTSSYNGSNIPNDKYVNFNTSNTNNVTVTSDMTLENMYIMGYSNTYNEGEVKLENCINANGYNFKIGRNFKNVNGNNSIIVKGIIGSINPSGTSQNPHQNKVYVESGIYNFLLTSHSTSGGDVYNRGFMHYGSDYDRVKNDNSKLTVYFNAVASIAGQFNNALRTVPASEINIYSGRFGLINVNGNLEYAPYSDYGVYIGGRKTQTYSRALRNLYVYGGDINVINGGGGVWWNSTLNGMGIYMLGGYTRAIYGGAAAAKSNGNRIISVTGGTVAYSVFGGSNAYNHGFSEVDDPDGSPGKLTGETLVYIGGNATIGDTSLTGTLFTSGIGEVFGAGNGNENDNNSGQTRGAHVIVAGDAVINGNVYGGGNYGTVGLSGGKSQDTVIDIIGGTIKGNIFGGSNQADTGGNGTSADNDSIIVGDSDIYINFLQGHLEGNLYGGSNVRGYVYGNSYITIKGGTIDGDIYGGGKGGYQNNSNPGTYIRDRVLIEIGVEGHFNTPVINGDVYGGSAYGVVNSFSTSLTDIAAYRTTVNVHNGIIRGSVYGGGKGDENFTPVVAGNVFVNVYNGNIGTIYGGCNFSGMPNGKIKLNLYNGEVDSVYGGGNNIGVKSLTTVNVYHGTYNNIFGGSNQNGVVNKAIVNFYDGNATRLYGGNNAGGEILDTVVNVKGGHVENVFGSNNISGDLDTTTVNLIDGYVTNAFGGGNEVGGDNTNLYVYGGEIANIYGGSNQNGIVTNSNVLVGGSYIPEEEEEDTPEPNDTEEEEEVVDEGPKLSVTFEYNIGPTDNVSSWMNTNRPNFVATVIKITNNTTEPIDDWILYINLANCQIAQDYTNNDPEVLEDGSIKISSEANNNSWSGTSSIAPGATFNVGTMWIGTDTPASEIIENGIPYSWNEAYNYSPPDPDVDPEPDPLNPTPIPEDAPEAYVPVNGLIITSVYGGNNAGGKTITSHVKVLEGELISVYGGGNYAETEDTFVEVLGSIVSDVFGGGNHGDVLGTTNLLVKDANILNSVYGGGNNASVLTETNAIIVKTNVGKNAFAGGNHGSIGNETTNASANIYVISGNIKGNVYGGCNTSVVYGQAHTFVGLAATNLTGYEEDDLVIEGTTFGGGEANEEGSESYDYTFIGVTESINVNIDAQGYYEKNKTFDLLGSIFGSGNASSSSGTSIINIKNLGTREKPDPNLSIQRADEVIIDNSAIELFGATDRTNEYSDIIYSLNRIKNLKLKNNSVLLLQENANLLESFTSLVDVNGVEEKSEVIIDPETHEVTKNVDNRLYLLINNNLNVTTNQAATSYGVVSGMTFLGMYQKYDDSYRYGIYADSFETGDNADAGDALIGGSYVIGLHSINHDTKVDGFYTNSIDEDFTEVTTDYIEPTPEDTPHYMWIIGLQAINYEVNLTASKYSSLGTYELALRDFSKGDTVFRVLGFNSEGLKKGVSLLDSNDVPKISETEEEANSIIGLSMKSETTEWTSYNTTKFLGRNDGEFIGDKEYKNDSISEIPSLMFYLYHAKNITLDEKLGTVAITLQAQAPINEIEYDVKLIQITVNISAKSYNDGDAYDASITYGKKYEMPSATDVNITTNSQFTAYFSMYTTTEDITDIYGNLNDNYHVLVTNNVLPVGTMITMIDTSENHQEPKYYYYKVDDTIYNEKLQELSRNNEVTYRLSDFISMGSTTSTNTYNDALAKDNYYNTSNNFVYEEFLFIFDFEKSINNQISYNNSILFELRNNDDRSVINVLGIRYPLMVYNFYNTSNITLVQNIDFGDNIIKKDSDKEILYETQVKYNETENRQQVIDTNYEADNIGLNVTFYDSTNTQVSSSMLEDTTFMVDSFKYHTDSNGIFRVRLAGKVSNLLKTFDMHIGNALPAGNYRVEFKLFASNDGLYTNGSKITTVNYDLLVVDNNSFVTAKSLSDQIAYPEDEEKTFEYLIESHTELENVNLRLSVYKRDIDDASSNTYQEVDASTLFTNTFTLPSAFSLRSNTEYEKIININPQSSNTVRYKLRNNVASGTYKLEFKLCNDNYEMDTVTKYIIIKKETEQ